MEFEKYSEENVTFHEPGIVPYMLKKSLIELKRNKKKIRIADIGCGDCNLLIQLINLGTLDKKDEIYGVDPSDIRLKRAKEFLDENKIKINLIKAFGEDTGLKKNYFDFIICTQVIEHVKDDKKLVKEIYRILRKNGQVYVTSVIKKRYGVYIYRKNGKFVSDPTHEKEYKDKEEFQKLFTKFKILKYKEELFKHPFLDLFLRFLIKVKIVNPNKVLRIYEKNKFLFSIRYLLRMPLIGFYQNDMLVRKN